MMTEPIVYSIDANIISGLRKKAKQTLEPEIFQANHRASSLLVY
jgi:hypothetical protein